ncbi:MAG: pyrimidine 5'-nucleotidase [Nitrosomonadales bacterium]|nr:pyrimidine 5'-nucleotidase [Nitrosomonadales bacterium]
MAATWIFDLDNTLHDAQSKIFPLVNTKMNEYISSYLDISLEDASSLRVSYWERYGATLKGLIKHHNINPIDFLSVTHNLQDFNKLVHPENNLKKTLSKIQGRKIIYTNAPKTYTNKILKISKIFELFDEIFTIEDSNFIPKPDQGMMDTFLKKYNISEGFFIDDVKENLFTAKNSGLTTIWITNEKNQPSFIDKKIEKISDLLSL